MLASDCPDIRIARSITHGAGLRLRLRALAETCQKAPAGDGRGRPHGTVTRGDKTPPDYRSIKLPNRDGRKGRVRLYGASAVSIPRVHLTSTGDAGCTKCAHGPPGVRAPSGMAAPLWEWRDSGAPLEPPLTPQLAGDSAWGSEVPVPGTLH